MGKVSEKEEKGGKVVVFGQDVSGEEGESGKERDRWSRRSWHRHDHHGGSFIWGFLLIFAGTILFLNTLNLVPWSVWEMIGRYWPVLLVLFGIDIVLGRSGLSRLISFFLTLGVFATAVGIILLKVSPEVLLGLPEGVVSYLNSVSAFLQVK